MKKRLIILSLFSLTFALHNCGGQSVVEEETKQVEQVEEQTIVSLAGNITETLVAMGLEDQIVGTDVTSTYPPSINAKPKVGHVSQLSVEGVASLNPTVVLAFKGEIDAAVIEQLQSLDIQCVLFDKPEQIDQAEPFITALGAAIHKEAESKSLVEKLNAEIQAFQPLQSDKKVLFIYARGLGTLMVAGNNTTQAAMIEQVGCVNAASFHDGFKTLTAESLVDANPDVILMFDSGYESLNATNDLLNVPGIKETNAGINNNFIVMDGQLLSCFGPRTGMALEELKQQISTLQ